MSSSPAQAPIVTRFAPSPTGHLHIGGARTALFCWAFARRQGGRFMIRIEDTDQARSSEESARGILEDLAWLGIEWDDGPTLALDGRTIGAAARPVGPYFQAQRRHLYDKYLAQLIDAGKAYPAFESAEQLDAQRKTAIAAKKTYRYDRASFHALPTPAARRARMIEADAAGTPYVVRFLAPAEQIVVHDEVLGDVTMAPGEMDDFVIRKSDGFPTYHFAVVIDDETMGVTHVLRAQEHLINTPRHVALQRALGFRTPVYAHMPLVANMDGSKMSKRDKAKAARKAVKDALARDPALSPAALAPHIHIPEPDLAAFIAADNDRLDIAAALAAHFRIALPEIEIHDFRTTGYLPEALVNFISLWGWNPGMKTEDGKDLEKFDADFLSRHFSLERIGKTAAKFDRAKLLNFNAAAIKALAPDLFAERFMAWARDHAPAAAAQLAARDPAKRTLLLAAAQPRARVLSEVLGVIAFALTPDDAIAFDPVAVAKGLTADSGAGLALLTGFRPLLEAIPDADWTPARLHTVLEHFAAAQFPGEGNKGLGKIAQPIRIALTGAAVSPPLNEAMAALGRTSVLARIDRALRAHSA